MKSIVLDTNTISDFQKFSLWEKQITEADLVIIPIQVVGELKFGFRLGTREQSNLAWLSSFLEQRVVELSFTTERTAEIYADLRVFLKQQGTPIPDNDIWIAACCCEHSSTLLTRDRHFEHLPQVKVLCPDGI